MTKQESGIAETLAYIHNNAWQHSRLGLARMRELLARMGNPQDALKFIHVAGTNGKGSVCAMLSAMLSHCGYRTGLYISPYIQRFNERIQLDGQPISDAALVAVTDTVRAYADAMTDHPTEFELITAIAFQYFVERGCDIVVLEVGLGGRLDATNVIGTPEVAAITAIGLDHTHILGDTPVQIAKEKAGIVKPGGDVVLYPQDPAVEAVMQAACEEQNARLHPAALDTLRVEGYALDGSRFGYRRWPKLCLPLLGKHQLKNAAVALTVMDLLSAKGWALADADIAAGLARTRWPARFEIVHQRPTFVLDGGHNPQGVETVAENLRLYFPGRNVTFLMGVLADKDCEAMLRSVLPLAARIYAVCPESARALPAGELAERIRNMGFSAVSAAGSVQEGIEAALASAGPDGLICAFGSLYMAGALRAYFHLN